MSQTNIINEIIETAKANNINQSELASRAGIRQETLSRAKKNPNLNFTTVQQLAKIAGLTLKLIPDNSIADKVQDGTLFPS